MSPRLSFPPQGVCGHARFTVTCPIPPCFFPAASPPPLTPSLTLTLLPPSFNGHTSSLHLSSSRSLSSSSLSIAKFFIHFTTYPFLLSSFISPPANFFPPHLRAASHISAYFFSPSSPLSSSLGTRVIAYYFFFLLGFSHFFFFSSFSQPSAHFPCPFHPSLLFVHFPAAVLISDLPIFTLWLAYFPTFILSFFSVLQYPLQSFSRLFLATPSFLLHTLHTHTPLLPVYP